MFKLMCEVLEVRQITSKKDGKEYTLAEFGVPSTYEKFTVFVGDESVLEQLYHVVGQVVECEFMLRGGFSGVSLQLVAIAR